MSLADACDRETAYLTATGDGLPALLTTAGGRWDIVQAYEARVPRAGQKSLYVTRQSIRMVRLTTQRVWPTYEFWLHAHWPVTSSSTGSLETEQRNFDLALGDAVTRILGPVGDKTHGGRFTAVTDTETREGFGDLVTVTYDPVDATSRPGSLALTARITYPADDSDLSA